MLPNSSVVSYNGLDGVGNGETIRITVGGTTPFTTATIDVYLVATYNDRLWCYPGNHWVSQYSVSGTFVSKTTYRIDRTGAEVVSIDSRRMYGQPNKDGELPGIDANAPSRNVNFAGWEYKGGLFVGYAHPGTGDQSGKARVQLRVPNPPVYPAGVSFSRAAVTLFSLAPSPTMGPIGSVTIKAVAPNDPNFGVALSAMRWDNRWETFMGALGTVSAADLPTSGSLRFAIDGAYSAVPAAFTLLSSNETAQNPGWHYFASPSYLSSNPQITNAMPRVWYLANVAGSAWGYGGVLAGSCPHGTIYGGGLEAGESHR